MGKKTLVLIRGKTTVQRIYNAKKKKHVSINIWISLFSPPLVRLSIRTFTNLILRVLFWQRSKLFVSYYMYIAEICCRKNIAEKETVTMKMTLRLPCCFYNWLLAVYWNIDDILDNHVTHFIQWRCVILIWGKKNLDNKCPN